VISPLVVRRVMFGLWPTLFPEGKSRGRFPFYGPENNFRPRPGPREAAPRRTVTSPNRNTNKNCN
jgi:hypothetical protein